MTFRRILLTAMLVLMASCQDKDQAEARFEINGLQDSYDFAADLSQKETFQIISDNVLWEIEHDGDGWLTVSPMRSLGGYNTVSIAPENNSGTDARSCTMQIKAENGVTRTVAINQASKKQ